jgi:general secretion pathway protein G
MKTAFTLIEILIVVILLGILAAIVVPQFIGSIDSAKDSACQSSEKAIETATALYRLRESAEPADIAALVATSANNDGNSYLPAAPICGNQADGTNTYVIGSGCSLNCGD